jgi:hypothetical protein
VELQAPAVDGVTETTEFIDRPGIGVQSPMKNVAELPTHSASLVSQRMLLISPLPALSSRRCRSANVTVDLAGRLPACSVLSHVFGSLKPGKMELSSYVNTRSGKSFPLIAEKS